MSDLLSPTLPAQPAAPPLDPGATRVAHPKRWLILFVVLAAECMDLLDGTIVNIAAPSIGADLHTASTGLQWIVGGYALTFAVGLVTGGRLGDIFGRRRLFLVGAAGFTLSSLLCGLAPSTGTLIAARLLQGGFAALLIPQGFGIIRQVFPPEEMGKAFGMFGPVIGLGAVLGPVIGGLLVDGDLFGTGWRMVFFVNLPLGLAALAAAARLLPESRAERPPRLDLGGAALISTAAGLLVYPLIQGRELGWPAWTFVSMAASVVALGAFAVHERRRERAGLSPLVTPSLLRKRAFSAGMVTAMVFFAGMIGIMFTFALCLQLGLHYGPAHAGVSMIAWALGTAIGAGTAAGALAPRFGRHVLHAGVLVMLAGVLGMLAVAHAQGDGLSSWGVFGPELLAGVGMGAILAPLFDIVLAGVDDDEVGSASGTLNAMQQLGAALGIAVLGTVFFSAVSHHGFVGAFERILWIEAGVLAVTAALVLLLPMHARET
jgi:EmrB/QacA subfamily drug resistance transporter